MLRRSGSVKELESALRRIRAEGPIEALVQEAREVATEVVVLQPAVVGRVELAVLEFGGDLLSTPETNAAIDAILRTRTVRASQEFLSSFKYDHLLWKTIAALSEHYTRVDDLLDRAFEAAEGADPLVMQRLIPIVRNSAWDAVSEESQDKWLRWASENLRGDAQLLSAMVLLALHDAGVPAALERLEEGWHEAPTGTLAAVLLDSLNSGALNDELRVASEIGVLCTKWYQKAREDASGGSFGFGGVDLARIGAELSVYRSQEAVWGQLVPFLTDQLVTLAHKSGALDWMALFIDRVPREVVAEIAATPAAILEGVTDSIVGSESKGPGLRFLCAAGSIDAGLASQMFLELSGSADDRLRVEAARSARAVLKVVAEDLVAGVMVQLAHEKALIVRAAAVRQLPYVSTKCSAGPRSVVLDVLRRTVEESDGGIAVAAVRGIGDLRVPAQTQVVDDLRELLERVAGESIMPALRDASSNLVQGTNS
jgi:hypothetical protein